MKTFLQREIRAAYEHAASGGQALHLMDGSFAHMQKRTPQCFKGRQVIAHLFDQNHERLISTAKKLGVRVIQVEHAGSHRQHIDLCGKPLDRAIGMAAREADEAKQVLAPLDLESVLGGDSTTSSSKNFPCNSVSPTRSFANTSNPVGHSAQTR